MKILIDGRFYGLENAGLGRYTINLIKSISLQDKNNEFIIFLRKKYFDQLQLPENFKKVLADVEPYSLKEQIVLPLKIYKLRPDLVHFVHFNAPLINPVPFIVTIHDMIMHKSKGKETTTLNPLLYTLKRFVYKLVFWNAVLRSKRIITPSLTVKNELIEEFKVKKEKIVVTHLGLDYEFKKPVSNNNLKHFVYVGNAYPHKNIPFLVDAVKKAGVILKISTSKGVFSSRLKAIIRQKDATENVKVLGYLTDREIKELYKNAVGFIYPSLIEGFGFQGLEAIASGTLLLASDIPVFKEIYGTNALYFDPQNEDSLIDAIQKAVEMLPEQRQRKIKIAQEFIRKYSWEYCAKKTLDIYAGVE